MMDLTQVVEEAEMEEILAPDQHKREPVCLCVARVVLKHAANLMREEGKKANTYEKQAQWDRAAEILENLE